MARTRDHRRSPPDDTRPASKARRDLEYVLRCLRDDARRGATGARRARQGPRTLSAGPTSTVDLFTLSAQKMDAHPGDWHGYSLSALLAAPVAMAAAIAVSPSLGAAIGVALALSLGLKQPLYLFPLLLCAVAFQYVGFIFGLQFGWVVVAGVAAGALLFVVAARLRAAVERDLLVIALLFGKLELTIGLVGGGVGRIDRLAALITVIFAVAVIGGRETASELKRRFGARARQTLVSMVGAVGVLVAAVILSLFATGRVSLARAHELGIDVGYASPRSLSNILGLSAATCLSAAIVLARRRRETILWGTFALVAFLGLMYTGSRMPVFAVLAGVTVAYTSHVLFGGLTARAIRGILLAGLAAITANVLLFHLGPQVLPFVDPSVQGARLVRDVDLGDNVRWTMWETHFFGASIFALLFGSGVGSMGNPHSFFLGTLGSFGLVGFAAVSVLLARIVHRALKARSALALGSLTYICLGLSSSSDVDRHYFWAMLTVPLLMTRFADSGGHPSTLFRHSRLTIA